MVGLEDLYICISNDFELLRFPTYGILEKKINSAEDTSNESEINRNDLRNSIELVNKEAVKVLEMCDGKRNAMKLLKCFHMEMINEKRK
uniref:Uncharacterized protein n=1 Tax=Caldicellulosiruptor owensensis TaxID=55205 RepID=A0A7C5V423_9FIRM